MGWRTPPDPAEPPVGEPTELYRLEILASGAPVRTVEVGAAAYLYAAADQTADFGAPPATLEVRIAQLAGDGLPGNWSLRTLSL